MARYRVMKMIGRETYRVDKWRWWFPVWLSARKMVGYDGSTEPIWFDTHDDAVKWIYRDAEQCVRPSWEQVSCIYDIGGRR